MSEGHTPTYIVESVDGRWAVKRPNFSAVYMFRPTKKAAQTACDEANERARAEQVRQAAPDLLAALKRPVVFTVEESEDVVRLSLDGIEIAAVDFNSAAAGALLQFDAARRSAIAHAEGRS